MVEKALKELKISKASGEMKVSFFTSFVRVFNPKKYRLLSMNHFMSVFMFFLILCSVATVATISWNYSEFSSMGMKLSKEKDFSGINVIDNSYLVKVLFNTFSGDNSVLFFVFLLPSLVLYVYLYLLLKYFLIAFIMSLILFLVYLVAQLGLGFVQSIKVSLYSITIMMLFDMLNISWYSKFFVSLALFVILNVSAAYFVTSDAV